MLKKPKKCTPCGDYKCQIPMPVNKRVVAIDICIADIVSALNAANIKTSASCCGHGEIAGTIILDDGRCINIFPTFKSWDEWEPQKANMRKAK